MLATTTRVTISATAATPLRAHTKRSAARPTQFGAVKGFDPLRCV